MAKELPPSALRTSETPGRTGDQAALIWCNFDLIIPGADTIWTQTIERMDEEIAGLLFATPYWAWAYPASEVSTKEGKAHCCLLSGGMIALLEVSTKAG